MAKANRWNKAALLGGEPVSNAKKRADRLARSSPE